MRTVICALLGVFLVFAITATGRAEEAARATDPKAAEKPDKRPAAGSVEKFLETLTAKAYELGLNDPELGGEKKKEARRHLQDWARSRRWIGRKVTWSAEFVSKGRQAVRAVQTKLQPQLQKARRAQAAAQFDYDFAQTHPHFRPADRKKRIKETAKRLAECRKVLEALEKRIDDAKTHPIIVRAKCVGEGETGEGGEEGEACELKIVARVHKRDKSVVDKLEPGGTVTLKGTLQTITFKGVAARFEVELTRCRASAK